MLRSMLLAVAITCLSSPGLAVAEPSGTLTNEEVVKLSRELSPVVLVALIQASERFSFETDTPHVIALAKAGVPPDVIAAMVDKASTVGSVPTFADGEPIDEDRVYLVAADGRQVLMRSTLDLRVKAGGFGRALLGDRSRTPMHQFEGSAARIRTTDRRPSFLICIAPASTNPESVLDIVQCEANKQRRVVKLVERTFSGANTGVGTRKSRQPFTYEAEAAKSANGQQMLIVRFTPEGALGPGEYAVVFNDSLFFDFGID